MSTPSQIIAYLTKHGSSSEDTVRGAFPNDTYRAGRSIERLIRSGQVSRTHPTGGLITSHSTQDPPNTMLTLIRP